MKTRFGHISINVSDVEFYKDLLGYLGFRTVAEYKHGFGATDGVASIWIFKVPAKYNKFTFHRKAVGLNHVAFQAESARAVDEFYRNFLLARGVPVLYGGPALYPEYEPGYYAVYFEDPDRIKLEVMYLPE